MALSKDTMSKCSEHLSAYKSACENHPDLKSFDSSLQQRTNKVIDSLTAEAEKRTNIVKDLLTAKAEKRTNKVINSLTAEAETELLLSQHKVHMEVSKHLQEVFQGVADFIVKSQDDVWENKALRSLVQAYLDSTNKTLDILGKVENYVENAVDGEHFIVEAVAQFEKELADNDVAGKKKYEKTLKKLEKFKARDNPIPFDGRELKKQFELVKDQQESLLKEVSEARKKLQEEYDHLHQASVISNWFFGAAFFLTAVASIALIATGVGVGWGIGLALTLPVIAIGWVVVHTTLQKRMDDLKRQEEALKELENKLESLGKGTEINETAMNSVSVQVNQLEEKISNILKLVGDVEKDEEETDIRDDLKYLSGKVKKLTEIIKKVGDAVSNSSKNIYDAYNAVMKKITGS